MWGERRTPQPGVTPSVRSLVTLPRCYTFVTDVPFPVELMVRSVVTSLRGLGARGVIVYRMFAGVELCMYLLGNLNLHLPSILAKNLSLSLSLSLSHTHTHTYLSDFLQRASASYGLNNYVGGTIPSY